MQQCSYTRTLGVLEHCKSGANNIAVFSSERYNIGDRSYRGKVGIFADNSFTVSLNGANKFERNTDTGKVLVRIIAVLLLWIYDRYGIGNGLLTALVVVGDY